MAHKLRRLAINFVASFLHGYGNVAWQVEFASARAEPLAAFRLGGHDKYLRVLYLDNRIDVVTSTCRQSYSLAQIQLFVSI